LRVICSQIMRVDMTKKIPEITDALIAEAKISPNGWVYHIDWNYREDQHVPPEAIVGAWADKTGKTKFTAA